MILDPNIKKVLITGVAGFIGFHLAEKFLKMFPNLQVLGIDNLNDYYSVKLKEDRLEILKKYQNLFFLEGDISDYSFLQEISKNHQDIDVIFHLAAQAGVRTSIDQPFKYTQSNLIGQVCILEFSKSLTSLRKIIYASSSSVYGTSQKTPFKESLPVGKPLSLYSATKQADELICESYSRLFDIPMIGLRFFTAYGPWGRPDMAIFKISEAISKNLTVELVANGKVTRDFTHISDIIDGIMKCIKYTPKKDEQGFQNEIFNLGTGNITDINEITEIIANNLNKKPKVNYIKANPTDMGSTLADITKAKDLLGYNPQITIEQGIEDFANWYKSYYR